MSDHSNYVVEINGKQVCYPYEYYGEVEAFANGYLTALKNTSPDVEVDAQIVTYDSWDEETRQEIGREALG